MSVSVNPRPWFLASCLAAFTAGHMINYSVILMAQDMLGSAWLSGLGLGLCFGPPLLLGWFAGVLCDRLAPGRVIQAAQIWFALAAAALWFSQQRGATGAPSLLLAAACAGVAWSFASPARMAALAQIVPAAQLKRSSVLFNVFVMLGFGLGPLMIALLKRAGGWPLVVQGIVVLVALASLLLLPVRTQRAGMETAHRQSLATEVGEGLRAVRSRPLLLQLMLVAMAGYLAMGPMQVLLPKLASAQLGLAELQRGLLLGSLALALILGGVLAMLIGPRLLHGPAIFVTTLGAGLALAALGSTHAVGPALALLAAVGMLGGMGLSLIVAGIQAEAPAALRGRVLSMYTIISQVVPAASGVLAGALVQVWGVSIALWVCGGTLAALMLINLIWMRALRTQRR
ncbi:MFS transporter [Paucibacter soli]|uniref:MFS transporter n=1 Tax=Paucibacter soli TaxID=3133433 RepID=UPI0030957B80